MTASFQCSTPNAQAYWAEVAVATKAGCLVNGQWPMANEKLLIIASEGGV